MNIKEINPKESTILIVEDEPAINRLMSNDLAEIGYQVESAFDAKEAMKKLKEKPPHLVIMDLSLPPSMSPQEGVFLFEHISKTIPRTKVIIISGTGDINIAMSCFKSGAADYIEKPISFQKLTVIIDRVLRLRQMELQVENTRHTTRGKTRLGNLIGESQPMQKLYKAVEFAVQSEENVLLTGETGTGKNLVAKTIHEHGKRAKGNYFEVNCAAFPENLIESELFGHEKGTFTGAVNSKKGIFESANEGTLLLDEIGELNLMLQPKLLHMIDTKLIRRVGGTKSIKVNSRIIAATNRDIKEQIREKRFREDLYYRLNTIEIFVPPLRERKEDIPLLVDYFFQNLNHGRFKWISDDCYKVLQNYHWPGNVRELQNLIKAVLEMSTPGTIITAVPFKNMIGNVKDEEIVEDGPTLKEIIEKYELSIINKALDQFDGSVPKAANYLGLTRQGLRKKIRKLSNV